MATTIDDLVERAAAATSDDERGVHLAAAVALAKQAWDWRRLYQQAQDRQVGDPAWWRIVVDGLFAASIAERYHLGICTVVAAKMEWGDPAGAREALEDGVAALERNDPAYAWVRLASAFVEHFQDRAAARDCLDLCGRTDVSARCDIARAVAEVLEERDEAVAILTALTPAETHDAWTLGNTWQALGEPARTRAVFDAALADAPDIKDVLTVARMWHSHDLHDDALRVLDVAASEASTPAHWLDIAETAHDLRFADRVRPAIEHAEEGPLDDQLRARVSAAWLWIGEAGRADAVGGRGVRPDALRPVVRELPGFAPSATALLDWLRERVDAGMLKDIARADYGNGFDKHLAALTDIVTTGLVPRSMAWEPGEVVRLRRWSDGDQVDHVNRGLCVTLCCMNREDGHNDVPILVETAVALGEPAATYAEALLAWLYATTPEIEHEEFAAVWGLALLRAAREPDDPRLDGLADAADALVAKRVTAASITGYCVRRDLWRALSERWFASEHPRTARWRALVG